MSPELQIIITFAVFLVLLTCGMAVPFAIAVPALFYLLLQGGLPSLNSLGLVSWGSMDSFTLSAIPLFILMAEILQESKLSLRVYRGLSILVAWMPGGPTLLISSIPGASARSVGMVDVQLPFGGPTVTVSYLVIFVFFIAFTIFSLYVAAGILAKAFNMLDQFTSEAKAEGKAAAALPAGETPAAAPKPLLLNLLELPLRLTGRIAAITARILRGVPKHLQ